MQGPASFRTRRSMLRIDSHYSSTQLQLQRPMPPGNAETKWEALDQVEALRADPASSHGWDPSRLHCTDDLNRLQRTLQFDARWKPSHFEIDSNDARAATT